MMKKRLLAILALVLVISLTGCAFVDSFVGRLTGSLFGKGYTITQYDDYGNLVFTVHGDKVTMDCQLDEYGEVTSYIDITIDGDSWKHVGSTLVFAQKGVDIITDFQLPEDMESTGNSTGLMAVDRKINHYANLIGKEFEATSYFLRTPAFWEGLPGSYIQAFGMIKWYDSTLRNKWFSREDAYLGLAFD